MAGPNAPYTALDFAQVLRQSFDETKDMIRVDANVTAVIGEVTVLIDKDTDSISIWDSAGHSITIGQKTMANSLPVVIASDQTPINVAQSGTWNINNITGTVSLPTGAATAANQSSEITLLTSIDGKIPSGLTVSSTRLLVDGSGVTQPVSATNLDIRDLSHVQDSVRLGDGTTLTKVNSDQALYVSNGLVKEAFDYVSGSHGVTTSTYTFKTGGAGGTTVKTVAIVYTDSTKNEISTLTVS
jgi:hypothetical protein